MSVCVRVCVYVCVCLCMYVCVTIAESDIEVHDSVLSYNINMILANISNTI